LSDKGSQLKPPNRVKSMLSSLYEEGWVVLDIEFGIDKLEKFLSDPTLMSGIMLLN